jgi:hypothetical protein
VQRLATTDRTLVMSRSAVRVRSSALSVIDEGLCNGLQVIGLLLASGYKPTVFDDYAENDARSARTFVRAGQVDIGWFNRLGWFEDFRLLIAVDPVGVITGSVSVLLQPKTWLLIAIIPFKQGRFRMQGPSCDVRLQR